MKRILSVLAALALISGSATCFGAAAISLNNYDANAPVYVGTSGTLPTAGQTVYVEILGGPDANSLQPVTSTGAGNPSVFALGTDGSFDAGIGIVPGVADNATASFVVHAWLGSNTPGGWASASQSAVSSVFTQATGNSTPPNLPAPATFNFPTGLVVGSGTPVIPEPTTIALALFGAAGLLFFRRK